MDSKKTLATEFLHEIEDQGERLTFEWETQEIQLKGERQAKRVPLAKLDGMILQFLVAHAALAYVSVSDVLDEVLSIIM